MTTYEYRCMACRLLFELRRPMGDRNDPATCPECGSAGRRRITAPQPWKGTWSEPRSPEELRNAGEIWEK